MITSAQVREARKLLGWSQEDLAGWVGVSSTTIGDFEKGHASQPLLTMIKDALEAAGVEFANGVEPGVKLKGKPALSASDPDAPEPSDGMGNAEAG